MTNKETNLKIIFISNEMKSKQIKPNQTCKDLVYSQKNILKNPPNLSSQKHYYYRRHIGDLSEVFASKQ